MTDNGKKWWRTRKNEEFNYENNPFAGGTSLLEVMDKEFRNDFNYVFSVHKRKLKLKT